MSELLDLMPERFRSKVEVDRESGCWMWIAGQNGVGYGTYWDGEKSNYAHRYAYSGLVGEIPKGLDLDHLCRRRSCCNPDHLEPVTRRENLMRSPHMGPNWGGGRRMREKTECAQGHPFNDENTSYRANGTRRCKECGREYMRRKRARQREQGAA